MDDEVREAVARLVAAFGEGRLEDYFACFAPDATFVFYTSPERLMSTDAYRALWDRWVRDDGFRVVSCSTEATNVQMLDGVGIVTHDVRTTVATNDGEEALRERETIVLARQPDGAWLGVHEHLSPMPDAG